MWPFPLFPPGAPTSVTTREILAAKRGTMDEKGCPVILPTWRLYSRHYGSFACRKSTTWDRGIYFSSEGRRAEDFFALKNPTASAGFEPASLGTKGQHATPRPPKPILRNCLEGIGLGRLAVHEASMGDSKGAY